MIPFVLDVCLFFEINGWNEVMDFTPLVEKIRQSRVYDVAKKTALEQMPLMSVRLGNAVYIKREDQQAVFSFKIRGAYNKISGLSQAELDKGVIGASAGNHAQGIALSARRVGARATIVMPKTTPDIKVAAVRRLGGEVVMHGNAFDDASAHALALAAKSGASYIHPYDDEDVIAGQGTVGREVLEQLREAPDAVFIPVGGGGLIAGMAAWIKHHCPQVKVIGVEPDDAPSMYQALQSDARVELARVGIFVDGVAVRQVGAYPFRVARALVDEMVLVNTDAICAAIKDIYDETRTIAEPAGALALAGLKKYVAEGSPKGKTYVVINSGANVNFDRLRHVAERAEIGEHKEGLFAVTIPERAGSFFEFCQLIGYRGITEFNYRYADDNSAHVFTGIQLREGAEERALIAEMLQTHGFAVTDLSEDEMAKLHIRYMVGGRAPGIKDERLYRFEFPERPGALLRFLSLLGGKWNISLFHYRNHGSDYGRVLCGFQVPTAELKKFQGFLDGLGYSYGEETDNPAYRLFLGH